MRHIGGNRCYGTALQQTKAAIRSFCCEVADWCDDDPGVPAGQRERLWELIRQTPNLCWALLTKRPENIGRFLPKDWGDGWPQVILGVTVEFRTVLDRLHQLRFLPSRTRFVSFEPLLEDLGQVDLSGIAWGLWVANLVTLMLAYFAQSGLKR